MINQVKNFKTKVIELFVKNISSSETQKDITKTLEKTIKEVTEKTKSITEEEKHKVKIVVLNIIEGELKKIA